MIKKVKNILALVACALCLVPSAFSQDLRFSQFFNSPLLTNPANTGFLPEGDYRIGFNYRTQWASMTAAPYTTRRACGDVQVMPNQGTPGWQGSGDAVLGAGA